MDNVTLTKQIYYFSVVDFLYMYMYIVQYIKRYIKAAAS